MQHKISIKLMGGLGNQLFQIFAALAYAIRTDRSFVLPYSKLLTTGKARKTYWDDFLKYMKHYTTSSNLSQYNIFNEVGFTFSQLPEFSEDTILHGYFQSYKYFENQYPEILKTMRLLEQQDDIKKQYIDLLDENVHNISLHFRLGDYKQMLGHHPAMPYKYYENSISFLTKESSRGYKILYFCEKEDNDMVDNTVTSLSQKFESIEFVKVDDSIVDWEQLLIMSCCDDNVIANSTYSWWAAYFNNNSVKKVCYPSVWFGPELRHLTTDLFPESWQKMPIV